MKKNLNELQNMDTSNIKQILKGKLERLKVEGSATGDMTRIPFTIAILANVYEKGMSIKDLEKSIKNSIKNDDLTIQIMQVFEKDKETVIEICENCEKNEILAYIAQFGGNFFRESYWSTPTSICELAIRILEINEKDTVLDLCSGTNTFEIEVKKNLKPKNMIGVEINTDAMFIALVKNAIFELNVENIQGNAISQDYSELKATKVFSNFPFGFRRRSIINEMQENPRLSKYFINTKSTASCDWAFSLAAFLNQTNNGKTVTIMANSGLNNIPDTGIRKYLVDSGLIEAVISLPTRMFTGTNVSVNILVMSHGNDEVKLVDGTEIFTEGRRFNTLSDKNIEEIINAYKGKSKYSVSVSKTELAKQEYVLSPARYIQMEKTKIKDAILLGDVCKEISRGAILRAEELDLRMSNNKTQYQYLMLKNINDGFIDDELPYLTNIKPDEDRYVINDGDIIMSKISPFKVAMARVADGQQVMANGNVYFLRADKEKINPVYLMLYLQSDVGMSELNRLAKGAVIRALSIRDLKNIRIPNISVEEQNKIVETYEELRNELIIIQKQKDNIERKMSELLQEVL